VKGTEKCLLLNAKVTKTAAIDAATASYGQAISNAVASYPLPGFPTGYSTYAAAVASANAAKVAALDAAEKAKQNAVAQARDNGEANISL
jgi:hypothetical protein